MRGSWFAWMLAAVPMTAHAAEPWVPVAPWTLDAAQSKCTMARRFSGGSLKLSLGFVVELAGGNRILIALPPGLYGKTPGKVTIAAPGIPAVTSEPRMLGSTGDGAQLLALPVDRKRLSALIAARQIEIDGDGLALSIPIDGAPKIAGMLDTCEDDLLRTWKIDPAEYRKEVHPDPNASVPKPHAWITADDYPRDALRARQEGEVAMIWRVETDGTVTDCRIVQSSGFASLDAASCRIIVERGRYRPYVDGDGRPAVMWASTRFRWTLPR